MGKNYLRVTSHARFAQPPFVKVAMYIDDAHVGYIEFNANQISAIIQLMQHEHQRIVDYALNGGKKPDGETN